MTRVVMVLVLIVLAGQPCWSDASVETDDSAGGPEFPKQRELSGLERTIEYLERNYALDLALMGLQDTGTVLKYMTLSYIERIVKLPIEIASIKVGQSLEALARNPETEFIALIESLALPGVSAMRDAAAEISRKQEERSKHRAAREAHIEGWKKRSQEIIENRATGKTNAVGMEGSPSLSGSVRQNDPIPGQTYESMNDLSNQKVMPESFGNPEGFTCVSYYYHDSVERIHIQTWCH